MTKILLSADDRTGALEIGGLVADGGTSVPVGPNARDATCCVIDIATRHLAPAQAQACMVDLLRINATHRAHKMDAGLRGNWTHEIAVLLEAGYRVAVVCSFPDAGRRCKDGVVYIHDLPVLESVFGQDPLNAPISSRPADVLEHDGVRGDWVVWDANDNAEMHLAIRRAAAENRILIGASGVLGAFAEQFLPQGRRAPLRLPAPKLVLCGSLNPLSREQIGKLEVAAHKVGETFALQDVNLLATPVPEGEIDDVQALAMADTAARQVRALWSQLGTVLIIGGDTVGAVVGDEDLHVLGTVAPGIPVARFDGCYLITKGGGIGQSDTLRALLQRDLL
ncbi:MAG: four-carbon acid sugar kinase family protein [Pseudomonadota bacterium]